MKLSKKVKFIFICLLAFVVKTSKRCLFVSLVYSEGVLYTRPCQLQTLPGTVNVQQTRALSLYMFRLFSTAENKCKGAFHRSRVPFALSFLEFHDFFIINIIIDIIIIIMSQYETLECCPHYE